MMECRLGLAEAPYVFALAEALPRSTDAVPLLLRPFTAADRTTSLHAPDVGVHRRGALAQGAIGLRGLREDC